MPTGSPVGIVASLVGTQQDMVSWNAPAVAMVSLYPLTRTNTSRGTDGPLRIALTRTVLLLVNGVATGTHSLTSRSNSTM